MFVPSVNPVPGIKAANNQTKNYVLKTNGTQAYWVPEGYSFTFGASFSSTAGASTQEIGTGVWKAVGGLSFSASYTNGPANSGAVSMSGAGNAWGSPLTLTNTFQGPTTNTTAVNHRTSVGNITFTLNSGNSGGETDTDVLTYTFYNRIYWGVLNKAYNGTWTEANVTGLSTNALSNSTTRSITVTAGTGQYIIYAYPSRLTDPTFYVSGLPGGFVQISQGLLSVTNGSGFAENYDVWVSVNSNLGSTTVTVT